MKQLTIALLCGGDSPERDVSLSGGEQVYQALDKTRYRIRRYDPKTDLGQLVQDAAEIDLALIIMHGPNGEDGTMQGMLDLLKIPYQGSGVLGSAVAMNKVLAKQQYERVGLPTPAYWVCDRSQPFKADDCIERLGLPLVVKPATCGSSVGMSIVREASAMMAAVEQAFRYDSLLLLEEYITGTELTGGVIGNRQIQALPIVEIIPGDGHEFFDYEAKYVPGRTTEICPARVDEDITQTAQAYAQRAHQALHCRGYSRTDFILRQGELYVLETNTIPGMTPTSLFPQAAQAAGMSYSQLLDRLIDLGLETRAAPG